MEKLFIGDSEEDGKTGAQGIKAEGNVLIESLGS